MLQQCELAFLQLSHIHLIQLSMLVPPILCQLPYSLETPTDFRAKSPTLMSGPSYDCRGDKELAIGQCNENRARGFIRHLVSRKHHLQLLSRHVIEEEPVKTKKDLNHPCCPNVPAAAPWQNFGHRAADGNVSRDVTEKLAR